MEYSNYYLVAETGSGGGITGSSNAFYAIDEAVSVTAVPGLGYQFTRGIGNDEVSGEIFSEKKRRHYEQAVDRP